MMIDQLSTQVTSVEADGGQAAAPASVSLALPDAGQSSSSQTPPLPEVNSPAAAGSAAAKPRVFKMSDEFLMFKFKVCSLTCAAPCLHGLPPVMFMWEHVTCTRSRTAHTSQRLYFGAWHMHKLHPDVGVRCCFCAD